MPQFGLIGYPLTHSWSKAYFTQFFQEQKLSGYSYKNFPLAHIHEFPELILRQTQLLGLNVTHPYKEAMVDFLDELTPLASQIGAVNCIEVIPHRKDFRLKGHNTDFVGFQNAYGQTILDKNIKNAWILGSGGSARAVHAYLQTVGISCQFVSRAPKEKMLSYPDLNQLEIPSLVVHATPLGMFPNMDECLDFPFGRLGSGQMVIDLIYNPEETLFLNRAKTKGAQVKNGLEMLYSQAKASWEIWQKNINLKKQNYN